MVVRVVTPGERSAVAKACRTSALLSLHEPSLPHALRDATQRNGVYWLANPVHAEENFADRWQTDPGRAEHFFRWMEQAQAAFGGYGHDLGVDRVLEKIGNALGESAIRRAGEIAGSRLVHARDAGALGISATGLLGRPVRRPTPQHTLHGDVPAHRDA